MPSHIDLTTLIENLQVGLVVHLPSTEIVLTNSKALELLGLTEDQILGKSSLDPSWNVVREDGSDFPGTEHPSSRCIATAQPVRDVVMGVRRPKSDDHVWLMVNAFPQLDSDDRLQQVIVTFTDISEHRRAESLKRRAEEWLKTAIAFSNIGLWDWNCQTGEIAYSRELNRVLGYDDNQLHTYDEWKNQVHPDDLDATVELLKSHLGNRAVVYDTKYRFRHQNGSWIWFYVRGEALRDGDGRPTSVLGCGVVITELKEIEGGLRSAHGRLESLSRQLIRLREDESSQLAREIHEELAQVLAALLMTLRQVMPQVEPEVRAKLDNAVSMIDQSISQVRSISYSLRPPQLDYIGLVAALQCHVKTLSQEYGIPIDLRIIPIDLHIPMALSTICFRIAEEAVTNAIRHAAPQRIGIDVIHQGTELHLKIRDDGRGFDVGATLANVSDRSRIGLSAMMERAALGNGKIEIRSVVGEGTSIEVSFPL